jgi:molybdopterin synthase catalytic subunit
MSLNDVSGRSNDDDVLVLVSSEPIDPVALLARVADPASGAAVLFLGTVRDHSAGRQGVTHLEYEAYDEVVESKIGEIVDEARRRWPVRKVAAVHRVGRLDVEEIAVGVAVSSPHRADAFDAGRYVIDELKARVPIWKKEHWPGGAEWVREDLEHGRRHGSA